MPPVTLRSMLPVGVAQPVLTLFRILAIGSAFCATIMVSDKVHPSELVTVIRYCPAVFTLSVGVDRPLLQLKVVQVPVGERVVLFPVQNAAFAGKIETPCNGAQISGCTTMVILRLFRVKSGAFGLVTQT